MKVFKKVIFSISVLIVVFALFITIKTIIETDMTRNIDYVRNKFVVPEIAVAVMNSNDILYSNVIGCRRDDTGEPAGPDDRFHIGSCTKAITSLIAGKLVDEGKIGWNTRLLDVYPEFGVTCMKEYQEITLVDLLSNRAGVQPFTGGDEFQKLPELKGTLIEQRKAFARWVLSQPMDSRWVENSKDLGFHFESKDKPFVYSNAGFAIAASMLEKVTGESWESLINYYLHDQLGMTPAFGWPNTNDPDQPWGHMLVADRLIPIPPGNGDVMPSFLSPAGDINLNLKDYAQLIQMQLKGLREEDNFLKKETYDLIHKGLPDYALGWENMNLYGHRVSIHDGTAGAFYCLAAIDDQHDLAFIIMANAGGQKAQQGVYWLAYKIFKNYNQMYWLFFL